MTGHSVGPEKKWNLGIIGEILTECDILRADRLNQSEISQSQFR